MRAQREKVHLLQAGDADPDEIMIARAKYQGQLDEYSRFSRKMGLNQERERIYYDMRGRIATNLPKQNAKYSSDMIRNATRDANQYDRYKRVIGDSAGNLAEFRQMKYNDPKEFDILRKKVNTHSSIDNKAWSIDFKQKSKDAYNRFADKGIYMSVHALSRLPRLNRPGYPEIEEQDVMNILHGHPNYSEGEKKLVFFDPERQLAVIKNKGTGDIISIVRRKNLKEEWNNV